ncbi:MAG: hypothetical protein HC901_01495 [Bdellovibrionaceae bacterium]|nr:hypothetical protein [Pseudobdellovibrionaceae bacterium]
MTAHFLRYTRCVGLFGMLSLSAQGMGVVRLAFQSPPDTTKPWCYWYWLDGDITKEGITKDLETMAGVGIGRAMIGNINLKEKTGPVKMMSPEWMALTRHALSEGNRLGVDMYLFNGPGWSQSGGPWIKPGQSMRRVMWREFSTGGGNFSKKVRPDEIIPGQDIAVLAVPQMDHVSVKGVPEGNTFVF